MHNKKQLIKQWGNQIDPEVSAETYLNSENTTAVQWAQEHEQALEQLDRDTINLYRRHREHSDFHSVEEIRAPKAVDPAKRRGNTPTMPDKLWVDNMLSRRAEDFARVVENPKLAVAMESLTPRQMEVVYQTFMKEKTPQEIAKKLNTTDRNVRDILARALENIKKILIDNSGEGYLDVVMMTFSWMVLPTFAIGWQISNWIYPKLKRAALGKAA